MAAAQPCTSSSAQASDNRIYLFRLQMLIIDGGLTVLRNYVDQILTAKSMTLSACLAKENTTITRLRGRGTITKAQYALLFPSSGNISTSDLDITLIICLLRNLKCFGLNSKFNWNTQPGQNDLSIEADMYRLKSYRNEMCHISTTSGIQLNDFKTMWRDIKQILLRVNSSSGNPLTDLKQKITDFKSSHLDSEAEERMKNEIKKWTKHEKAIDVKLELVTRDVKEVKDVLGTQTKRQAKTHKRTLKNAKDVKIAKSKIAKIEKQLPAGKECMDVNDQAVNEEQYQQRKKEFKDGLITFYKTRHSQVFLSPLFEEKDTPLASFYIRPELNSRVSTQTGNDKRIQAKSLSQIFKTEKKKNQEIYVLADAGLGKTAFSKYLANVWCQAHLPDEELNDSFLKDDIDCMQEFDFIFLVLLRDASNVCSIDELIFENIVSDLGLEEKLSESFLLKILKNEKCLVILDGLDEWTHPEKECNRLPRSIPHRNDREKCTVLTTTRPWKLGVLNLNSRELGEKVELIKLSHDSAVTLTERILKRLKSHPNKDALRRDVTEFIIGINRRHNDELTYVPLLLIYTICLWCDGVQIRHSKCELYINIVELLLSRTIQKHGNLQQLCDLSDIDIPVCLAEYKNCSKYYTILMCLGELAYYTLFNETKESTLVFDGSVAEKFLSTDEMKFTLHSGMLSESTSKTLTKKFSKVSFSHKTVQEFFASLFISFHSNAQENVLAKCRTIQNIVDMSQIWQFVSKMNADRMFAISNDLMSVINEDEETYDYRTRSRGRMLCPPLWFIQDIFMSCLQEMPESENIQLCLQDFFIDEKTEYNEQLQRLLKQNKTNIKSLQITTVYTSSSIHEIIDLFSLTNLCNIQTLFYEDNMLETKEAEINRILFPSLQNVTLVYGRITRIKINKAKATFAGRRPRTKPSRTPRRHAMTFSNDLSRVQNLQYLDVTGYDFSNELMEIFFNFISGNKSLKELILGSFHCEDHWDEHVGRIHNLDLSQHLMLTKVDLSFLPALNLNISTPSLVSLRLAVIDLDERSLLLSRDMLNIERVKLDCIKMSAGSLQIVLSVLESLPQSVTVNMAGIKPETEYKRVREYLRRSQTFHVIRDDGDDRHRIEFKTKENKKRTDKKKKTFRN